MRNLTPTEAAEMLHVSPQFIRIGLQQGVLPFGSAVKMSQRWTYLIPEQAVKNYMEQGNLMRR